MTDLAFRLLNYALEHVLLCLVVVPLAYAAIRIRTIAPEKHAALLLAAFAVVIVGPAISLPPKPTAPLERALAQAADARGASGRSSADAGSLLAPADRADRHGAMTLAPEPAQLLLALWLTGAGWRLLRLATAQRALRRILAASQRSHELEAAYRQLIPAGVEIHVSPSFGPAAIGIARPRIVLPQAIANSLPAASLRAVVLHEASHIRRQDLPVLLSQRLIEALFWWNPLLRSLAAACDSAREIACDLGASRAYGSSADYAEALLVSIERLAPAAHRAAPALCATAALSTLDQRIDAIIEGPRSPGWTARATLLGVGAMLAALWIATDAVAPRIALRHPVASASQAGTGATPTPALAASSKQAVDAPAPPPSQQEQEALLALHDDYSRFLYDMHDRYSQTLYQLTDAHTRDLSALADAPDGDDSDRRLARLNQDYERMRADAESRFRTATALAQTKFLHARKALGHP